MKSWVKQILFFGALLLIICLTPIFILMYTLKYPEQEQLEHSVSPNNINEVEVVMIYDFPDPIFEIRYDQETIQCTKGRGDISIYWEDDYKAFVRLDGRDGEESRIFVLTFD
ncbi:hypothetical protein [Alkalicoccobacillus gibsonii]|uniref:hypothetical protein n=1 Tax=Alkalicoccobacillus gibsonii TaxID=79881 RepID=UPI003519494A